MRIGGVLSMLLPIVARQRLNLARSDDRSHLFDVLDWIDGRPDCADFAFAVILWHFGLDGFTAEERERIKQTALGFRYWTDEPGNDAMCFLSENHSLLFHGCQMKAGYYFPDDTFENTGLSGAEHYRIGRDRCRTWLDRVEQRGFVEFHSGTYVPLTCIALIQLVDSPDPDLASRAHALVDQIFEMLALHTFDGVTVGPQGRVYRGVLYPADSGTQAMLSFASKDAVMAYHDLTYMIGASRNYAIPATLNALIEQPARKTYRQSDMEIQLEKTPDYLLTSLNVPASFQEAGTTETMPQEAHGLIPGRQGYQQHLWYASLARDCHVFVNHPGCSYDMSISRPGFWYGNGIIPHTRQTPGTLLQIFNIPHWHPIAYTHAHWPSDAFDEQRVSGHWAFGKRGTGYIGLWCSAPMMLHSEVLTDRELRAQGRRVAWVAFCGAGNGSDFKEACQKRDPVFDAETLTLHLDGKMALTYPKD